MTATDMTHLKQPRPDSGLGFHVKVLKHLQVVESRLETLVIHELSSRKLTTQNDLS